jgi:hypothetical protein
MHGNNSNYDQKYKYMQHNQSQNSTPSVSPTSNVMQHLSGFVQVKQKAQPGNPQNKP